MSAFRRVFSWVVLSVVLLSAHSPAVSHPLPYPADQEIILDAACDCCNDCPAERCIRYRRHPLLDKLRKLCKCGRCDNPKVSGALLVRDPQRCKCLIEVPVCLPLCCRQPPKVETHKGPLKRGSVTFCWKNGYKIRVVFDRHGDIVVHYHGW